MARRRLIPARPGFLEAASTSSRAAPDTAPPIAKVSGQSAEAATLRDLAKGIETARNEGRMVVEVPLEEVAPEHLLRDRAHLGTEELEALKTSIAAHGQRVPAELVPLIAEDPGRSEGSAHRYGLISGWRRLRALQELFAETGAPQFGVLRALIRPGEVGAAAYVAMVEENEVRVGLSYYERARLVVETTRQGVFADHTAALRTLFATASRAKRSKIASFIDLHQELGDVLRFPAEIPERLGLMVVTQLRAGRAAALRRALQKTPAENAAAEAAMLTKACQPAPASPPAADGEPVCDGVTMQSRRKGQTITVTLQGAGVDDAFLEELRRHLHKLKA